jgi:hypothetical protein
MWQWRRRPSERDLDDEIAFHLAEEAKLRVERGEAPDGANAAAHRAFGNDTSGPSPGCWLASGSTAC